MLYCGRRVKRGREGVGDGTPRPLVGVLCCTIFRQVSMILVVLLIFIRCVLDCRGL
jgi:hypothetical protein